MSHDQEGLLIYAVIVLLSFTLSTVYLWLTAKNDQFSYPAKLRGIVKKLPWVAMISFPVLVLSATIEAIPDTVELYSALLGVIMILLGLLAIIAALFHRQSRDRVTKPFENEHAQKGWGWFIAILTALATIIAFVAKAIINLLRAINWSDALTKPEKNSHNSPKNHWEDASRLSNNEGSYGHYDSKGNYKQG